LPLRQALAPAGAAAAELCRSGCNCLEFSGPFDGPFNGSFNGLFCCQFSSLE